MRVLMTDLAQLNEPKKSGVGHYTQGLTRALRELAGRDAVYSFPDPWLAWAQGLLNGQSRRYEAAARRPGRLAWAETKVRGKFISLVRAAFPIMRHPYDEAIRRSGCEVYHEPNYAPLELDLPTVATVHDLSVLLHPQWHPAERITYFEKHFTSRVGRCVRLFTVSEFCKGEIVRHLGWPAERVSVTPNGVRQGLRRVMGDELARGLRAMDLPEGYLLHVGTLEPRKNVLMLAKAYCSLPAEVREKHPLVLAGGKGWNSAELHAYLESEAKDRNVRWLGYVRDEQFPALYSGARVLLLPAHYEGFGMPAVEMMACGGAVLASTAGALVEVCGGRAHYIDAQDMGGWRDAMLRVCAENDWLDELRRGTEDVAARYTWRRCAEASWEGYHLAAGRPLLSAA